MRAGEVPALELGPSMFAILLLGSAMKLGLYWYCNWLKGRCALNGSDSGGPAPAGLCLLHRCRDGPARACPHCVRNSSLGAAAAHPSC